MEQLLLAPLVVFLLATSLLVVYKLVSGEICTQGLLLDPRTGVVSALRVQQLLATLVFAGSYSAALSRSGSAGALPPVPSELLLLIAGSNGIVITNGGVHHLLGLLRQAVNPDKGHDK